MAIKQTGSKLDRLYSDGRPSQLDQLYSSPAQNDATKAAARERRVDQRMYRKAVRDGDLRGVQMFHNKPGFQAAGGITRHGQFDAQDRQTGENFTQEGQRLYNQGRGQAENGADAIEESVKRGPLGTVDGSSAENAAGSLPKGSTGGVWVNTAPSATGGGATPPSGSASAESGNLTSKHPRAKFVSKVNELREKEGGLSDSDRAFAEAKGKSLGLNDDQIFDALDGQSDLSPKAVIARAGERKDRAQAAKITSGLLDEVKGTTGRVPSPMDIDNPFRSSRTGFEFGGDIGPAITDEPPLKDLNPGGDFFELTSSEGVAPKKASATNGQSTNSGATIGEALSSDAKSVAKGAFSVGEFLSDSTLSVFGGQRKAVGNYLGGVASIPFMLPEGLPGKTGDLARETGLSSKVFRSVRDLVGGYQRKSKPDPVTNL
jgi:hypothetical protein